MHPAPSFRVRLCGQAVAFYAAAFLYSDFRKIGCPIRGWVERTCTACRVGRGGVKQKNSSDCSNELFSVPRTRLELARTNVHYPLKVACLPISPPGRHCRISHFGCANIELIFEIAKFSTDLCRKKDFFRAESAVEAFAGHIPEPRGSLPGPLPAVAGADISTVAAVDAAPRPLRRNGGTVPPSWGERSRSVCAGACHLASGSRTVPPQRTKSISRKR